MLNKIAEIARPKFAAKFGAKIENFYEIHPGGFETTLGIADMVGEFHRLFQHPTNAEMTPALLRLRANLINEEGVEETAVALAESDLEKVIDSMADALYVGIGTLISIDRALENALTYFTHEQSESLYLKYVHADSKTPHDDIALGMSQFSVVVAKLRNIADQIEENTDGLNTLAVEMRGSMNLIYVASQMVYHLAHLLKIDVLELIGEIHRSNMTKLWPSDATLRTELVANCKYDKEDLAFRIAEGRDGMIGYRISDGKILKSPTYEPADLTTFVSIAEQSVIGRHFF